MLFSQVVVPTGTKMYSIISILLICLLVLYIGKYVQFWLVRLRLGLPGPPPSLPYIGDIFYLLGNRSEYEHLEQLQLIQKYGPVVAYTRYGVVHILIADLELIRSVSIKKADYFGYGPHEGLQLNNEPYKSMISVSGPRWRTIRNTISPIFTTSMIKHTMELMKDTLATFEGKITKAVEENRVVDGHVFTKQATMEIMIKKSFSIDAKCQVDKNDPFMENSKASWLSIKTIQIMASLPFSNWLFSLFGNPNTVGHIFLAAQKLLNQRETEGRGQNRRDFLELLLKTQENVDEDKKLTRNEILAQSLIFPVGGVESTSSAAAFLLYIFALHPEAQEKARAELDNLLRQHGKDELTYEMLHETPYFDMCYQESQRLYTAGHQSVRRCTDDCEVEGIHFKKGMVVVFPIYAIHHYSKLWPDPEKFIPERFTAEEKAKRSPYTFIPFGHGPRSCVGLRLANLVVKLIVLTALKRFVVTKTPETMVPLVCKSAFITPLPKGSMMFKFQERK